MARLTKLLAASRGTGWLSGGCIFRRSATATRSDLQTSVSPLWSAQRSTDPQQHQPLALPRPGLPPRLAKSWLRSRHAEETPEPYSNDPIGRCRHHRPPIQPFSRPSFSRFASDPSAADGVAAIHESALSRGLQPTTIWPPGRQFLPSLTPARHSFRSGVAWMRGTLDQRHSLKGDVGPRRKGWTSRGALHPRSRAPALFSSRG